MFNTRMPDGLHIAHFTVLNHLIRLGDGKTPVKLAKAFQVTQGTMTHTLGALSKRGLIKLLSNTQDGRSKIVLLTDEGRQFHKRAIECVVPSIVKLGDHIDWASVARLLPELQRIRSVLDENRDT